MVDNGDQEACHSQGGVVVEDCGEPVHMQWKDKHGGGSSVYQVTKWGGP